MSHWAITKNKQFIATKETTVVDALKKCCNENLEQIVIDVASIPLQYEELRAFFADTAKLFCAIFYQGTLPAAKFAAFFDGEFIDNSQALTEQINTRKAKILTETNLATDELDRRTCQYLYIHHKTINFYINFQNPYGFDIPLMDMIYQTASTNDHWFCLQRLERNGLVEASAAEYEIQCCEACDGGVLNFKNCCPHCESVNIHYEDFIHCFSCGHSQQSHCFQQDSRLECPRCHEVLKHIGIDYDKPIEDKTCLDCHAQFFEANTLVLCMVCSHTQAPESLQTRSLKTLSLTELGKQYAQGKSISRANLPENFFDITESNLFSLILGWQYDCAKRYKDCQFLLAVFDMQEMTLMGDKGDIDIGSIYKELRESLRNTDLVSVIDKKLICLLPFTPDNAKNDFKTRFQNILQRKELKQSIPMAMLSSDECKAQSLASDELISCLLSGLTSA